MLTVSKYIIKHNTDYKIKELCLNVNKDIKKISLIFISGLFFLYKIRLAFYFQFI